MKLLLAVALVGVAALVVLARGEAEAPLEGPRDVAPPAKGPAEKHRGRKPLKRARCPHGVPGCRSVRGRIVYVEAVDPDGDGDLHVVVADGGITLPGLTSIDVAKDLRPKRDPGVGDRATGAGPVQTGSYGQSQIHALRFAVQR